jgi:hypothetical protein
MVTDSTGPSFATTSPGEECPMITTTFVDAFTGTRLRGGYVAPSAQPSGKHFWRQSPPVVLDGSMIENNSTGVSEVECRHR